jgi:CHAD domain-containing protein
MTFRFRANETIEHGSSRIAAKLVRRIINGLADEKADRQVAIHNARKDCKRVRALLRLIKPAIGDFYASENAFFRDAADQLSAIRDSDAMIEALEALRRDSGGKLSEATLVAARVKLGVDHMESLGTKEQFSVIEQMCLAHQRVSQWACSGKQWKAAKLGFNCTYRHGLHTLKVAHRTRTNTDLHQWRKYVKYHGYQMQLMQRHWKGNASKRIKQLDRLSELLGHDHDLAVMQHRLVAQPDCHTSKEAHSVDRLLKSIKQRRKRLQAKAFKLGKRLYRKMSIDKRLGKRTS